jgi:hypothetical protein
LAAVSAVSAVTVTAVTAVTVAAVTAVTAITWFAIVSVVIARVDVVLIWCSGATNEPHAAGNYSFLQTSQSKLRHFSESLGG